MTDGPDPTLDDQRWTQQIVFPHIPDLHGPALLTDALHFALTARAGVVVTGPKGAGKSYARRMAVADHARQEALRAEADPSYQPEQVITLKLVRAARPADVYVGLFKALIDEAPETRARGRRKDEDELREEFLHLAHEAGLAAVVIDETEHARGAVLDVARDLMSAAEELYGARARHGDGGRTDADAAADDGPDTRGSAAQGIGVLLVGTPVLRPRIDRSVEAGQRWAKLVEVPPPHSELVPAIYATWLPGFAPAIQAMGMPAWSQFVRTRVVGGRPVAMRQLARHAREYVRFVAGRDPGVRGLADVPLDCELFRRVWNDLDRGNGRGDVG